MAVLLFGAVALVWQPRRDARPQPSATGTIRGRIVAAATGDPIRNARVTITDDHEHPPLLSDADGRFAFLDLPAGAFTLTVGKPGFAKTTFGARAPGEAGMPIRVADGSAVDDVVVALLRGAAIAGLVVDAPIDRRRAGDIEDPNFLESLIPHAVRVTLDEGVHISLPLRAR